MLRMIARWFISRSIDEDVRLSNWLRRWIDCDEELKQFEILSQQLGNRLKKDAPHWIASQALPADEQTSPEITPSHSAPLRSRLVVQRVVRRKRKVAWSLAACALAACALLAFSRLQTEGDHAGQPRLLQDRGLAQAPASETISAADREWLVAALKTGRIQLGRLQAQATELPRRARVVELPGVAAIVEPTEVAGMTAGRALANLDRGMQSEQQQLNSDIKAAVTFFAYRLPASMARLVGWQPPAN
jgi:hypothetical protein